MEAYHPSYNEIVAMLAVLTFVFAAIMGTCNRLTELEWQEYEQKKAEIRDEIRELSRERDLLTSSSASYRMNTVELTRYAEAMQRIKEACIGGKEYRFVSDGNYVITDLWYDSLEDAIASATKSVKRTGTPITITDWKGCELTRVGEDNA